MNKARRKEIARIEQELWALVEALEAVAEEERSSFENLPENLMFGDRGQAMEAAAEELQDVQSELSDLAQRVGEAAASA